MVTDRKLLAALGLLSWPTTGSGVFVFVFLGGASNFLSPQTFRSRIGRSYINIYTRLYKYGL